MSYYSNNTGAKLYMGASTADTLPAPGADSFTEVPYLQVAQPVAWEQTVGPFYILNDTAKRSVGGRLGDQNVTGTIVLDNSETVHQTFFTNVATAGGTKRNWYLEWPDGLREDFVGFVSRCAPASFDATGDAAPHLNEFTISIDGAVTRTNP